MKNNKGLVITIIILVVLAVVMASYIIYGFCANKNTDNNKNDETIEYTYDSIKGLYTYFGETKKTELGNEYAAFFYLYLYENGTFNYKMGTAAPYGYMGNYIIKDNTIILNYLFRTSSGADITVTSGTKTITITSDGSLVDSDPTVNMDDLTSVTLKKESSEKENQFLYGDEVSYSHDFSKILNDYYIINNATKH